MSMIIQPARFSAGGGPPLLMGTRFDPTDKGLGTTLSNDNRTVSMTTANYGHCRGIHGKGTGKWRFQVTIDAEPVAEIGIGISGPAFARNTFLAADGQAITYVTDGRILGQASSPGSASPGAHATGNVIDVYLDADAGKMWYSKNGVFPGTTNPTTGAGGLVFQSYMLRSFFLHCYLNGNGTQVTIETDGDWTYPGVHTDYLPWSAEQATTKANAKGLLVISRGPAIYFGHTIGEMGLRATSGGSNWLVGGTATAAGSNSGNVPANVVDGNPLTWWEHSPGGGANQSPSWIRAFAASPGGAEYAMIQARSGNSGEQLQAPTLSDLYLSADGVNYDKAIIGYDWGAWTAVPSGTPGTIKELALTMPA